MASYTAASADDLSFPVVIGKVATTTGDDAYKKIGGEWIEVELQKLPPDAQAALLFWGEHAEYVRKQPGARMRYHASFAGIPEEHRPSKLASLVPTIARVSGGVLGTVGYKLLRGVGVKAALAGATGIVAAANPVAGAVLAAAGSYFSAVTADDEETWPNPRVQVGRYATMNGTSFLYRGDQGMWQRAAPVTVPTDMMRALQYWGKLARYAEETGGKMMFIAEFAKIPTLQKKRGVLANLVPALKTAAKAAAFTAAGAAANDATKQMVAYANQKAPETVDAEAERFERMQTTPAVDQVQWEEDEAHDKSFRGRFGLGKRPRETSKAVDQIEWEREKRRQEALNAYTSRVEDDPRRPSEV